MFVPGAETSGLISKFGVVGPRELELFTSSPVVIVLCEIDRTKLFLHSTLSAARIASPSVWDMSNVGMNSKSSPRNVPDGFGAFVPPAKL